MDALRAESGVSVDQVRSGAFLGLSLLVLGLVLFGFSFTYWAPLVQRTAAFGAIIHVHAGLWFGWFVLLAVQALAVSRRRLVWHRSVGVASVAYTAVLVAVALFLAVRTIARDAHLASGGIEAVGTIIPFSQILMFSALFGGAILNRNRPATHKRLLILAALVGSTPAFARISIGLLGGPNVPLIFVASNLLLIGVVLLDWRLHRRLHPVYLWGGLAIVIVRTLRIPLAMSSAWTWFANQLAAVWG